MSGLRVDDPSELGFCQRWQIYPPQPTLVHTITKDLGVSPLLAQVLINRGLTTPTAAREFINPDLQSLPDPQGEFPDLGLSLELLAQALATQSPIAICGDYDVDGMTSTALLLRTLGSLGGRVHHAIPDRMHEGYGLNLRIVEDFARRGVKLVLTVDNGISALGAVARARELGLAVIITDHHDLPAQLPPANAILNPKQLPLSSPYRSLAGVGIAYILAVSLVQHLHRDRELVPVLLELFALGTIADLAPLNGVNRRWVKRGLRRLATSQIPGVQALLQVAAVGKATAQTLKPEDVGFQLGPRINAIGRIGNPQVVIELLTTEEQQRALALAQECEAKNLERQELCARIEQEALALIKTPYQEPVLLLVQPTWHHGVVGIVASRLVERLGVPVFLGTFDEQGIRGSARGIPEFHVFQALEAAHDVLERYGGHQAAGGFSLKTENLAPFRQRLEAFAMSTLGPEPLKPLVAIDAWARLQDLTWELQTEIDSLHPCGLANPDPVFWTPRVQVLRYRCTGKQRQQLRLILREEGDLRTWQGVVWRWDPDRPVPPWVDLAYHLRPREWRGETNLELEILSLRPSQWRTFQYQHHPYTCGPEAGESSWQIQSPQGRRLLVTPQGAQVLELDGTGMEIDQEQEPYRGLLAASRSPSPDYN